MLEIKNISKKYGNLVVLDQINLSISKGDIVCLMGPSGAGKTTLLRCLNQLEKADSGFICFDDVCLDFKANKQIKKHAKQIQQNIGMVFQNYTLFPHLTVLENIIKAPIYLNIYKKEETIEKAKEMLCKVGLLDKINHYPKQLSGGQKQRIAILRACILNPEILCFDEPTSALHQEAIEKVIKIIKELSKDMGILIVTHDEKFASSIASHKVEIKQGKLYEIQ